MNKKRIVVCLLALVMSLAVFAGCGGGNSGDSGSDAVSGTKDPAKFVIGVDDSFPPMGFRDEKNEVVGFDIDLARATAEHMDKELVVQVIDWSTKELELENGNIDAIWNGLTITDERKEAMDFTEPYLENDQIITVQTESGIKTKADLEGKKVGLQKGSSAEDAYNKDDISKTTESFEYPDNVSALNDLKTGRIDAVVLDSIVSRYYIKSEDAALTILDDSLSPELYGIGVKKGNTELKDAIEKAMEEMKKDGTAAEISTKWFGSDILYQGAQ